MQIKEMMVMEDKMKIDTEGILDRARPAGCLWRLLLLPLLGLLLALVSM